MDQPGTVPPMSPTQPAAPSTTTGRQPFMFPVVGLGDWFVTILLTSIPLVNIIMLFIWAFSSNTNPSKANWAKATLLWMLVGIVIAIIVLALVGTAIFHAVNTE